MFYTYNHPTVSVLEHQNKTTNSKIHQNSQKLFFLRGSLKNRYFRKNLLELHQKIGIKVDVWCKLGQFQKAGAPTNRSDIV